MNWIKKLLESNEYKTSILIKLPKYMPYFDHNIVLR